MTRDLAREEEVTREHINSRNETYTIKHRVKSALKNISNTVGTASRVGFGLIW